MDVPEATILRREYKVLLNDEAARMLRLKVFGKLRIRAIAAVREKLLALRRSREIGEDAYKTLEEELDWAEGNARRDADTTLRKRRRRASRNKEG